MITDKNADSIVSMVVDVAGDIVSDDFNNTVSRTIKYMNKKSNVYDGADLENHWYQTVAIGKPDYGVYNHPFYLAELLACWIVYSRGYIKNLLKLGLLPEKANRIIDLGCGLGLTTIAFREIYPEAEVIGTNIKGTQQYNICQRFSEIFNFSITEDVSGIGDTDIIFASEYFEHIVNPMDHLLHIITNTNPKHIYTANSFNAKAIGHFPFYCVSDEYIPASKMGRIFGSQIRLLGYEKMDTKLWNNRPSYWKFGLEIDDGTSPF